MDSQDLKKIKNLIDWAERTQKDFRLEDDGSITEAKDAFIKQFEASSYQGMIDTKICPTCPRSLLDSDFYCHDCHTQYETSLNEYQRDHIPDFDNEVLFLELVQDLAEHGYHDSSGECDFAPSISNETYKIYINYSKEYYEKEDKLDNYAPFSVLRLEPEWVYFKDLDDLLSHIGVKQSTVHVCNTCSEQYKNASVSTCGKDGCEGTLISINKKSDDIKLPEYLNVFVEIMQGSTPTIINALEIINGGDALDEHDINIVKNDLSNLIDAVDTFTNETENRSKK